MTPEGRAALAAFRADKTAMQLLGWLLKWYDAGDIMIAAFDVQEEQEQPEQPAPLPDNVVRLADYRVTP